MKKSQIQGQVFVYIMAIVILGGLLVYGYYAISQLRNKADEISFIDFKKNIETTVKSSSTYGNVKIQDFSIPSGINEVCLINTDFMPATSAIPSATSAICTEGSPDYKPVICNAWQSQTKQN